MLRDLGVAWADPNALAIALYLDGSDDPDRAADGTWLIDDDFLVLVNAWWESLDFVLPETRPQAGWQVEIDTYDPVSQAGPATAERKAGDHITVGPRSVVVLKNRTRGKEASRHRSGAGNTHIGAMPGNSGAITMAIRIPRPDEATKGRG
jgi:hypothetical protein